MVSDIDTHYIFKRDMLDLCGRDFYYSHRIVSESFDMYKTHAHNHYELYFLLSGERNYFIGNRIVHVQAGDVVFVPAHIIHKTTAVSQDGHERLLINFTEDYFEPVLKNGILKLFKDYCITIPESERQKIQDIFSRISAQYKINDKYTSMILKATLSELFASFLRIDKSSLTNVTPANKAEEQIKRVLDMLDEDISSDITVDMAAHTAGLSKSHFEKTFRQLTGFTFIDYLNTMRLLKAQRLLAKTRNSITDIAFECGFNSSNYFTTVFKKRTGITPLKFRKNENNNDT